MKRGTLIKILSLLTGLILIPLFALTSKALYTSLDKEGGDFIIKGEPKINYKVYVPNLETNSFVESKVILDSTKTFKETLNFKDFNESIGDYSLKESYFKKDPFKEESSLVTLDLDSKPTSDIYLNYEGVFACGSETKELDQTFKRQTNEFQLKRFKEVEADSNYVYKLNDLTFYHQYLNIYSRSFGSLNCSRLSYKDLSTRSGIYDITYRDASFKDYIYFESQPYFDFENSIPKIYYPATSLASGKLLDMSLISNVSGYKLYRAKKEEGYSNFKIQRFDTRNTYRGAETTLLDSSLNNYFIAKGSPKWTSSNNYIDPFKNDSTLKVSRKLSFIPNSNWKQANAIFKIAVYNDSLNDNYLIYDNYSNFYYVDASYSNFKILRFNPNNQLGFDAYLNTNDSIWNASGISSFKTANYHHDTIKIIQDEYSNNWGVELTFQP